MVLMTLDVSLLQIMDGLVLVDHFSDILLSNSKIISNHLCSFNVQPWLSLYMHGGW